MKKEDFLFNMLKETTKTSSDVKRSLLAKKYPGINFSELHRRIVNYQVEKYGRTLDEPVTKLDYIRVKEIARKRRKK